MRIVFLGTPAFAVPTLQALVASSHKVVAVITQPDRPRGRGQRVTFAPVKVAAIEAAIPVLQPDRLRDEDFARAFDRFEADLGVVAAYGKILPESLIKQPRLGMINVHASLLPRWRGAAPVHRAILAGDSQTGVTIMRVVRALDAGPMLAHEAVDILPNETSAELEARLASVGATLLLRVVDALAAGPVVEAPQDDALATYASRIERADGEIDWARPAQQIHNQVRGLHPWPHASARLHGRRVLLIETRLEHPDALEARPGEILEAGAHGLVVASQPGAVRIVRLQPEGRAVMAVRDFLNGHRVAVGDRFESLPPN